MHTKTKITIQQSLTLFLALLIFLMTSACSNSAGSEITNASLYPNDQIVQILDNKGWEVYVQESGANLTMIQTSEPFITAQKGQDLLFVSLYPTEEEAQQAYYELISTENTETIEINNTKYEQCVIDMNETSAWVFRLFDHSILGYFSNNSSSLSSQELDLNDLIA